MIGIDVAGLLLGAIPVIIEGYGSLEKTFAFFETLRSFPREIKKLDAKLGTQKTVFRNNCINLLSALSDDRHAVYAMLSESTHVNWQNENFSRKLADRVDAGALDESFLSCHRTMNLIHESLQSINREVEGFKSVLNPPNEVSGLVEKFGSFSRVIYLLINAIS